MNHCDTSRTGRENSMHIPPFGVFDPALLWNVDCSCDNGKYPCQGKTETWPCRPTAQIGNNPRHMNTSDDEVHVRDTGYASRTYCIMYQKPYGYTCF